MISNRTQTAARNPTHKDIYHLKVRQSLPSQILGEQVARKEIGSERQRRTS